MRHYMIETADSYFSDIANNIGEIARKLVVRNATVVESDSGKTFTIRNGKVSKEKNFKSNRRDKVYV